ncbi:winged helix-turn-helix domain-containing protein [Sphingobium sp. HBC34]|uniref:Winged helix-turn-helix domain-containing protein n=1 Tax=Sphingobium cyanobacteriorum TaxID=3063954 RepID=A0ABT8ZJ55_9SPHN|nr:winged helix-turn-helix domain-containing protein [Sphingobium sp. HBC34]MDO7834560.1 winged helix-turn-helix domain-containing protein [Sphingobium sp. HBC34]
MGRRIECHGLGADFASIVHALKARGVELAIRSGDGDAPLVRTGNATILWQDVDDPAARARALEAGMQEVVGPWMHEAETIARIIRLADADQHRLRLGNLLIHLVDRRVERGGRPIVLLTREYELLLHLARRPGQAISRTELLRAIWRLNFDPGTNSVEVHMSRLRAKLDRGFAIPLLHTRKGQGYMLCPDHDTTGLAGSSMSRIA